MMQLTKEHEESIRRVHAAHVEKDPECEVCMLLQALDNERADAEMFSLNHAAIGRRLNAAVGRIAVLEILRDCWTEADLTRVLSSE